MKFSRFIGLFFTNLLAHYALYLRSGIFVDMQIIEWTKLAIEDLKRIYDNISKDSVRFAKIQVIRIRTKAKILKSYPLSGKVITDIEDGRFRELVEGNYRIIYEIKNVSTIEILCVIHGRRLLKNHPTFLRKTKARTSG